MLETLSELGLVVLVALFIMGGLAGFSMLKDFLYAHSDLWLDRTRNRITDQVDSPGNTPGK